jgi:hypothetical protein
MQLVHHRRRAATAVYMLHHCCKVQNQLLVAEVYVPDDECVADQSSRIKVSCARSLNCQQQPRGVHVQNKNARLYELAGLLCWRK